MPYDRAARPRRLPSEPRFPQGRLPGGTPVDMLRLMNQSEGHVSICEIVGCSGEGTTTRWIITEDGGKRELRVCRDHIEGEIDPERFSAGT